MAKKVKRKRHFSNSRPIMGSETKYQRTNSLGTISKTWGINNLYVVMLGPDWRLTYTLVWEGPGITVLCLEIMTHKEYDRRFGYRTT